MALFFSLFFYDLGGLKFNGDIRVESMKKNIPSHWTQISNGEQRAENEVF